MGLFSKGVCPVCHKETSFFSKSGIKYNEEYICMNCAKRLSKFNINIFNIKEKSLNELKEKIEDKKQQSSSITETSDSNKKVLHDPDLALDLFNTLSVGFTLSTSTQTKVNKILQDCNCRQDILNKVIEICGTPDTPKKRYIYAMAYGWSNKEYRRKAIYYIELYLSNTLYEEIYLHRFRYLDQPLESRRVGHLTNMYSMLTDLYTKEYEFELALSTVNKMIELDPYLPTGYRKKVDILVKMGKIDDAILYLVQVKKSKVYSKNKEYIPVTWMIDTINELLADCKKKKKENYVYKPRKTKIDYI